MRRTLIRLHVIQLIRKSQSAPQCTIYLDCGLTGHRGDREADTRKKAVKRCLAKSKYNICPHRDCGVAKESSRHDSASPFAALTSSNTLSQRRYNAFQGSVIYVGNKGTQEEPRRHRPAESDCADYDTNRAQNDDESANTS
jgi:hypothetical protein